ncbi:zinc-dependent peptidase [Caldimonas sp. KR1-144]|uniref:M90 family metallopeptidase n=1 Tax=Caldimonas sp. KR1-144 TaxID=3400911 RepID=UPI003BFF1037
MFAWWRRRRDARALAERPVPDDIWQATLERYPFIGLRDAGDLVALRRLATLFLDRKQFHGAGGLRVDDAMAVAVAAQACLPVLHLGLGAYDGFVGIVMHPDEVVASRSVQDETGIVHEYDEVLAGEAMQGGPVMLSWQDVAHAGEHPEGAYNVVIHEFMHVLDMVEGEPDGVPPLPREIDRRHWVQVLEAALGQLERAVDAGRATVLDPYGCEGLDEFFPVAAEAFFVAPHGLRDEAPALYDLLSRYFRQDPAAVLPRPDAEST